MSLFDRRLEVLKEIQTARLRLADAHIALAGRRPTHDEQFRIEALEIHLRELGQLMDELDAGSEETAPRLDERITIQKQDDDGEWMDIKTVWAKAEVVLLDEPKASLEQILDEPKASLEQKTRAEWLEAELRRRKWTMNYLATQSGVKHTTIKNLLNGKNTTYSSTLEKLRNVLPNLP